MQTCTGLRLPLHSTRFAATCAHALDAPPLNCRPPSPVFSPRHAFASTHTAALHIRAPHAPRSLQSSHVPRCSAPDVLVFAHDRPRSSRRATNPHVLDPTRPRAPPCGQSCRLTRPPTLLARTPRRHSSLHSTAALLHTTSHSWNPILVLSVPRLVIPSLGSFFSSTFHTRTTLQLHHELQVKPQEHTVHVQRHHDQWKVRDART